jgi:hypothetical protein
MNNRKTEMKLTKTKANDNAELDQGEPVLDQGEPVSPWIKARQELVEMGLLVDTGKREWSPETNRYEIVWGLTEDHITRR